MTPAHLAALRALVEADPAKYIATMFAKLDDADKETFNFCVRQTRGGAAQEALERLTQRGTPITGTNSVHDHGNCELCDWQEARLARLETALKRVRAMVSPAIVWQHECDLLDAALEGRDE